MAVRLVGERRTFAALAEVARITHRLAYESAARLYGDEAFYNAVLALDDETLRDVLPEGATVVDFGCGTGRWCRRAAPYADRVVGIDRDATRISIARARTTAQNVEYEVGDLSNLLAKDRFDVALLIHVVEHVDDAVALLRGMHAVARSLLVEVPRFPLRPCQSCPPRSKDRLLF